MTAISLYAAHVRRGRCPLCRKYRTLDRSRAVPTSVVCRGGKPRADGRPQRPTKLVNVCTSCAEKP